jgi:hypothetical protein
MAKKSYEAKLEAEIKELTIKRDELRSKFEAEQRALAHYDYLQKRKEDLQREIAELEGREHFNSEEDSEDE